MEKIKFKHIAMLLVAAYLIWLYMDSRKKATTAAAVADTPPIGDEANNRNVGGSSSETGNYNLVATPTPIIINAPAPYSRSYAVGTVGAGAATAIQDQQGGGIGVGGTGSGGTTSGGGMDMASN